MPEAKTTNVFEGKPDARQSTDPKLATSRFRPAYRALSDEEKALHDEIKAKATELETLFDKVRAEPSRYKQLAITDLEKSVMWIVKELTT